MDRAPLPARRGSCSGYRSRKSRQSKLRKDWEHMSSGTPKREVRHPDRAASTGAYSDGVILDGWLYISGQGPVDLRTGKAVAATIEEETHRAMENIGKILEAAGCSFDDVVKCTCHLADIRDFSRLDRKSTRLNSSHANISY